MGCAGSSQIRPHRHSLKGIGLSQRLSSNIIRELKKGMTIEIRLHEFKDQKSFHRPPGDLDCLKAEISSGLKTKQEIREIQASLFSHFLFRALNNDIILQIIDDMVCYTLNKDDVVFNQGDEGFNFFLIGSGLVQILIDGAIAKTLERGEGFGELALLYGYPRKATCVSLTRTRLWGLSRESFRRTITLTNERNYLENKIFLKSTAVFSKLTEAQLEALLSSLTCQVFNPGEKIISLGEEKPEMYLIKEGTVNIYNKNTHIIYLHKGEYFGEQAIMYNTRRVASVKAVSRTVLLTFSYQSLVSALGDKLEQVLYINTIRIDFRSDPLLSALTDSQINRIVSRSSIKQFHGTYLRYPSEELWVVIQGMVTEAGKSWPKHSCVNSQSLLEENAYSLEVEAESAVIAVVKRTDIEAELHCELKRRISYNQVLTSLMSAKVLKLVPETALENLSVNVKRKSFKAGEIIFTEGDVGEKFYIVNSGSVKIIKNHMTVNTMVSGEFFGERALLFNEARVATAQTEIDCDLWVIRQTDFMSILDLNLREYLTRRSILQDDRVSLSSLTLIKFLTKGSYSNVFLVKNPSNDIEYALKSLSKNTIQKFGLLSKLISEKNLNLTIDFPLVIHLIKTFKNNSNLFFLFEHLAGPNLLEVIQQSGSISLKQANFYTACILMTLNFIHSKGIIHREIIPENFILDQSGYPILTHFLMSKIISGRTYSFVGVPHYVAPEVIKGDGYTFYADIWSLGIMVYEMLYGIVPFGESEEDPFCIYKAILEEELRYPVFIKESLKVKLVEKLISKVPALRGTAENLMKHEWFDGTPWDSLYTKRFLPGFIIGSRTCVEESEEIELPLMVEEDAQWAGKF